MRSLNLTSDAERHGTVLERTVLEHQFENLDQQHECAALGMWVFLATEVLFFGAMFLGLGAYRFLYPEAFELASTKLNYPIGALNTVVLLVSSYFMVMGVHAARVGHRRQLVRCLWLTAILGCLFLVFKAYEYYSDYRDLLIPGLRFDDEEWIRDGLKAEQVPHVKLFLVFYWIMTGFHAFHVTIGIVVVMVIAVLAKKGRYSPQYYSPVDVTGLYWHFVDLVWIFLFPLLYLLGTHTSFHI